MTSFAAFASDYFAAGRPARRTPAKVDAPAVTSSEFTAALIALAAQLSAIDGTPKKSEYVAFQSLFVAEGQADEGKLRSLFIRHASGASTTLQHARYVAALTNTNRTLRRDIFARFVRIATADGMLNAAEMEWLRAVGLVFELEASLIRQSIAQCFTAAGQSPYAVLGVVSSVSDAELRAAYMARVSALHPDRYQAAGASAETVAMLSDQLAAVNAAYEAARKSRQKKSAFAPSRLWAKREKSAKAAA